MACHAFLFLQKKKQVRRRVASKGKARAGTFLKQLVDFITAQVHVVFHLETQFAEGAVDLLGVLLGPWSPPQTHPRVKLSH